MRNPRKSKLRVYSSAVVLWHTSMHHWPTPCQLLLFPRLLLAVQWEGVLWIVFAPGGRGRWVMSGQRNELGGHIPPWPRCCCCCCCVCVAFVCIAREHAAHHMPRSTPWLSTRWFNVNIFWLNISQLRFKHRLICTRAGSTLKEGWVSVSVGKASLWTLMCFIMIDTHVVGQCVPQL